MTIQFGLSIPSSSSSSSATSLSFWRSFFLDSMGNQSAMKLSIAQSTLAEAHVSHLQVSNIQTNTYSDWRREQYSHGTWGSDPAHASASSPNICIFLSMRPSRDCQAQVLTAHRTGDHRTNGSA